MNRNLNNKPQNKNNLLYVKTINGDQRGFCKRKKNKQLYLHLKFLHPTPTLSISQFWCNILKEME